MPRNGEINYELYLGSNRFNVGRTVQSWTINDDNFRVRSSSETTGIAAMFARQSIEYISSGRLTAAGLRCVVPDLVGFGRSDKPARREDHTFARHVAWMSELLFDRLGLTDINLFGQDWGALIGLRLVGARPHRFARVAIGNGGLPVGPVSFGLNSDELKPEGRALLENKVAPVLDRLGAEADVADRGA